MQLLQTTAIIHPAGNQHPQWFGKWTEKRLELANL